MSHDHHLGTPCWVDLRTTDPAASADFYTAVLGWRCQDKGPDFGHYRTCWAGQDEVAGIGPSPAAQPSAWTVYLAVDDAEATAAAFEAAGGERLGPVHPVGELGHMGLVQDPWGAVVGLWQAGSFAGFPTGAPFTLVQPG